jgi:hypothetical protein
MMWPTARARYEYRACVFGRLFLLNALSAAIRSQDFLSRHPLCKLTVSVSRLFVCSQPARCTGITTDTAPSTRGRILVRYPLSAAAMSYIVWLSLIALSGCVSASGSRMSPRADSLSARSVGGN